MFIRQRVYFELRLNEMERLMASQREADQRAIDKAEAAANTAIGAAKNEADERLLAHNGVLEQMKALQATFAPREVVDRMLVWQSKVTGALVLLSFLVTANLIRLWT